MFKNRVSTVVISDPDIQAALSHLRDLPYRAASPVAWDRQHLLALVREALPAKAKVGDLLEIEPGVYGIIKPFGVDLAGGPIAEGRLQIWIAVRSAGTDPNMICVL